MAQIFEIYTCHLCGNEVEYIHGGGPLACCGETTKRMTENTMDAANEKQVPEIEKIDGSFNVTVGSAARPMEATHCIEWIEFFASGKDHTQYVTPETTPEAVFRIDAETVTAREFCNLHGVWKA
ncbi:MAG: desulfoferrodoxin [Deltaproteobacteria bacterium]|nr:MAG: desulfoferrodoxin [Deltaproteobacteria bacterium]